MEPTQGPGPPARLRIIIADDDALVRRVVRDALHEAGVIVIAEASNGREAIELARHHRPDIVVMDVIMPGVDGLEATRIITRELPGTAVLMLTASGDAETAMLALRSGAAGFLSKDVDLAALPRALHGIMRGEAAITRELTMTLIERFRATRTDGIGLRPVQSVLSRREWEVLDQLCLGAGTEDITAAPGLTTETVRSHVKSILRKLGVSSRAEAVGLAESLRGAVAQAAPQRDRDPV